MLCGQEKKGELYRVLCRAAVELPAVRPAERNPELEARCQKLRREQVCHFIGLLNSVAYPDPGCLFDLGIRMGKKSWSGIRIRDEQPGSHFRELRNNILG